MRECTKVQAQIAGEVLLGSAEEGLFADVQNMGGIVSGSRQVMSDHDDGDVLLAVQLGDEVVHFSGHVRVKTRDWFVQEQQSPRGA